MDSVLQDLRHAVRQLMRSPGFTAAAVLTLALGIGANATVFSVVNAFLFRPLPVKEGKDLLVVGCRHESNRGLHGLSFLDIQDMRGQVPGLTGIATYTLGLPGASVEGQAAERVVATYVSANYFDLLGVPATLGRVFASSEADGPGAATNVVLSHGYWQRRFGGDPGVLGRSIGLNGHAFTVIGVAPPSFHGAYAVIDPQVYTLLGTALLTGDLASFEKRDAHELHVLARLAPGMSAGDVAPALRVVGERLALAHPESNKDVVFQAVPEVRARPEADASDDAPLVAGVFSVLVGLVLLVACVNVANLLLVRGTARAQEMAVRASLGASQGRLRRQLLTETVLLALLGGAAGAGLGALAANGLSRIQVINLPLLFDFSMDWRVFALVAAAALASAVVAGVAPAWRGARVDLVSALRDGGRTGTEGKRRLRDVLVVAQVMGCVVLLVAAGLFVRSLSGTRRMDLGFDPHGVVNVGVNVAQLGYDEARGRAFYEELDRQVGTIPGVVSAGFAYSVPMGYYSTSLRAAASPAQLADKQASQDVRYNMVSPAYFRTLRVRLTAGREFTESDRAQTTPVVIVNEELARRLWPGQSPLGQRLALDRKGHESAEVVGVTTTGHYGQLLEDPEPYLYLPFAQVYDAQRVIQVKTAGAPATVLAALTDTVHRLDGNLALFDVGTLEASLEGPNGFFLLRAGAFLAGILGALGLVLSLVGVYGVVSFSAVRRTREIGVRVALGAQPAQIARLVVGHGLVLAAWGLGSGALLGLLATQALKSLLYGVSPYDPLTFVSVAVLLTVTIVGASLLPAMRATRVDPMHALRCE